MFLGYKYVYYLTIPFFLIRWSSSTKLHNKNGSENKPHRKNSNPMSNFNFGSMQQVRNCDSIIASLKLNKMCHNSMNTYC